VSTSVFAVTSAGNTTIAGTLQHNGSTLGVFGTTAAARSASWSVTGGYTADKAFNPESTSVTEVARVLGTLIDALKTYGLLGA
jgi:hypothetical protein